MAYPKSQDKQIRKLSNILTKYAELKGFEFCFGGEENRQDIYPLEAFSFFGGLVLFLVEAKETYEKIYNDLYTYEDLMAGIGKKIKPLKLEETEKEQDFLKNKKIRKEFPVEFVSKDDDTYFGFIPKTKKDISFSFAALSHFSLHALDEYVKTCKKNNVLINGKIPLDLLFEKMVDKINQKQVVIKAEEKINPSSASI